MKVLLKLFTVILIVGCSPSKYSIAISKVDNGYQVKEFNGETWDNIGSVQPTRKDAKTVKVIQEYNQQVKFSDTSSPVHFDIN